MTELWWGERFFLAGFRYLLLGAFGIFYATESAKLSCHVPLYAMIVGFNDRLRHVVPENEYGSLFW